MKKLFITSAMAIIFIVLQACNSQKSSSLEEQTADSLANSNNPNMGNDSNMVNNSSMENNQQRQNFLAEAASGGEMEVEMGKLAQSNASSPEVKQFAAMMITDHTKAGNEIKTLLLDKGASVPVNSLEKHEDHLTEFANKKGKEFDKAYMKMMVEAHNETIVKFENASNNEEDPEVKAFASKTLPVLRKHLAEAKKIQDSMKD